MSFKDFPAHQQSIDLLQRSLERGRLGHAYLFSGTNLEQLESLAGTLAKILNCLNPVKRRGVAVDCCDRCLACKKIANGNHADVHWVRPESKSRVITIEQMRALMKEIQLKPNEAEHKVAIVVAADRFRVESANAFLKTLEEPPANSVLILITTDQYRLLETIISRCLRLNFAGDSLAIDSLQQDWLFSFSELAGSEQRSLLSRYRLIDILLKQLTTMKASIEEGLAARSPLQRYKDAEKNVAEKWEAELAAAVEAEYRKQRSDLLSILQWWLRDVWLETLAVKKSNGLENQTETAKITRLRNLLRFPELKATMSVAQRISPEQAVDNLGVLEQLHHWLGTNVQEALALEVGMLKLHF